MAAVGVVVQQIAEATHHPRGGGAIVIAAEHSRQLGIIGELGPDALKGVGVELHISIHKDEDLAMGCSGRQVAGGGGA